jgi:hypothetical protein
MNRSVRTNNQGNTTSRTKCSPYENIHCACAESHSRSATAHSPYKLALLFLVVREGIAGNKDRQEIKPFVDFGNYLYVHFTTRMQHLPNNLFQLVSSDTCKNCALAFVFS